MHYFDSKLISFKSMVNWAHKKPCQYRFQFEMFTQSNSHHLKWNRILIFHLGRLEFVVGCFAAKICVFVFCPLNLIKNIYWKIDTFFHSRDAYKSKNQSKVLVTNVIKYIYKKKLKNVTFWSVKHENLFIQNMHARKRMKK